MSETPPLWFTQASVRFLLAAARKRLRASAARFAAGEASPAEWRAELVRTLGPAVATVARLSRGNALDDGDRRELASRLDSIAGAADAVAQKITRRADALAVSLALADAVRHTHVSFTRASAWDRGAIWERRVAGPGCPATCEAWRYRGWYLAGNLPTGGDYPGCRCRIEFAFDFTPPTLPGPHPRRVAFRRWTLDEVTGLGHAGLRALSPEDAGDALSQLGHELPDDAAAVLEDVATPTVARDPGLAPPPDESGFPPNPRGNHFSEESRECEAQLLPHLIAVYDPSDGTPAEVAASLVRAAGRAGADSHQAYSVGRCEGRVRYEPARSDLHARMVDAIFARPEGSARSRATLAVGGPTADCPVAPHGAAVVSPRDIAARLPEYQGWNYPLLSREAADVAMLAVRRAAATGRCVFLDWLGCVAVPPAEVAGALLDAGYEVHGVAAGTPDDADSLAESRFAGNPFGETDPQRPAPYTPRAEGDSATLDRQVRSLRGFPGLSTWKAA